MKKIVSVLIIFLLMTLASVSHASQALDVLKNAIDNVISILEDPRYQDVSQKEEQQKKIWNIIKETFDFKEMARRAVANKWKNFTAEEQTEFADVFGRFLGKNYVNKIQTSFAGEKIIYLRDEAITGTKTEVMTKAIREGVEIPIDYRMLFRDREWKIYDVTIEGVSLTRNYRAQFRNLLIKDSPAQLIDRLKKKIEE